MSLNAAHRSIMIYSDSQVKAEEKLNEIIESLNEEILIRKKDFVKTPTKTMQARWFSEYCRGYRYQEVYVDQSLKNNRDYMDLIIAKLVPPHYYNGVEYDENYNWRDHVHYFLTID